MHAYAQTNIQLFNQLHRDGYRSADLEKVVAAHELAATLMTGQFRASGKTFIAHLVGTASIVASVQAACPIVAAALVHAAYSAGDFGDDRLGPSDAKRDQVRSAVGDEVEDYVWRYHNLPWDDQTVRSVAEKLDRMTAVERGVVLMRLANELEDFLDLGMLYCGDQKRGWTSASPRSQSMIGMARNLGYPALAEELQRTFDETTHAVLPPELLRKDARNASFLLPPRSYQRLKDFFAARLASLEQARQTPRKT